MEKKNNDYFTPILIIIMIWIMWFASVGLLSELYNGEYFWLRVLIAYPFSIVNIKVSRLVWNYYN